MDAKGARLDVRDILYIYARKFLRLAPAYYGMWFILWGATARIGKGSMWHVTDHVYETCKENWFPTLIMMGNILPNNMMFTMGCYQ